MGSTLPVNKPVGTQQAKIILDIDHDKFWDLVNNKVYWSK